MVGVYNLYHIHIVCVVLLASGAGGGGVFLLYFFFLLLYVWMTVSKWWVLTVISALVCTYGG